MNIIVSAGLGARCEITKLSSVPNWLISQDNAVPIFGHIEDSIVGIGELTQSHTQLSKYAVCSLYKNCKTLPVLDKDSYTGREAASLLFRNTPINYTRASGACPDLFKNYINYLPEDKVISIVNGQIKSGVIEKKSIGSGSPGNIFHTIANDYSPQHAITIMHEMQQVGIAMNSFRNCTLSIADLILPPAARLECEEINSGQLLKSHLINDRLDRGEIVPPIGKTVQQYFEELQIAALSTTDIFVDTIMRHIVPANGFITNGFLKMILFGSKGSPDNLFNMIAAVGQRLTNGKRPKMDFGYCRAGPHTRRFDQNPLYRDYIQNGYVRGLNGLEYFANARYARYDLILKQLFTSVSGKQSRISAINLESIYINNLRMAVKSKNIIQFCYGEDCLDTRRIITVKFPTVMISNEAFATAYKHPQFPAFFAKMQEDRDKYRRIFSRLERFNEKDVMSDERKVSIDVAHIVTNVLNDVYSKPPTREIPAAELAVAVSKVEKFCDVFPYFLLNEIQERRRTAIPDWILAATWLPCMLIRSHLHPNALAARKITPSILDTILVKIRNVYMCSLIDPGMAVGIVAATSFSAFLTQYIIDAHRRSAEGGTSKSGMHQMKEILAAKEADKLSAPSMLIPVQDKWANSETAVREIANTLEAMNFVRFVSHYQIFFEKMGDPVHPKYAHEAKDIAEFARLNPLLRVPADLINFCIRYDIIHTEIIFKNISMENIVEKLRQTYPETFIMYTPENSGRLYIRVYMRNSMFKSGVTEPGLIALAKELLTTLIRGINNIKETKLVKLICTKTLEDGSVVRENDKWAIKTVGTNLVGVLQHPQVDTYNVMTEAIQELADVFGIEAARQKIILGMKNIVQIIHTHYTIYADEMTFTGRVTNIESTGLKTRSPNSVLLQAGSAGPVQVLEHAAVNGLVDDVTGLTAPMLVGDVPRYGTNYNQIIVNEKFVRDNVKAPDSVFESALA
jgi:DNA-directed RNA polymerase beta' subunit